jgi:hypothetical protein
MLSTGPAVKPTTRILRVLLRDQNKALWTEAELEDLLDHGLTWWNMVTPVTSLSLMDLRTSPVAEDGPQGAAVLWGSVVLALTHLLWRGGMKYDYSLEADLRETYEGLLEEAEIRFEESKRTKATLTKLPETWN